MYEHSKIYKIMTLKIYGGDSMNERRLTEKQEIFCLAIADGKTQIEAYKIAYQPKSTNRGTLDNNAYIVGKNPKIRARIEELRKMRDERDCYSDINDMNKRFRLIWERIAVCAERGDDAAVARYLTEIGKLKGDYVTNIKDVSNKPNTFQGITTDDIKAMLADTE